MSNIDNLRFSDEFWMLFFQTLHQMVSEGLMPSEPDQESADLFFTHLAARMIDMADGEMPPLDETIHIILHILKNEIVEIDRVVKYMEQARDN